MNAPFPRKPARTSPIWLRERSPLHVWLLLGFAVLACLLSGINMYENPPGMIGFLTLKVWAALATVCGWDLWARDRGSAFADRVERVLVWVFLLMSTVFIVWSTVRLISG